MPGRRISRRRWSQEAGTGQGRQQKNGQRLAFHSPGAVGPTPRLMVALCWWRFDTAIDPGTAICIQEFGINDQRTGAPLKTLHARLTELIKALNARHIEVPVVGAGRLDLSQIARANGALNALWKLPPHKYSALDGAHYNAEGYAIVIGQMLPQVEALIARRRRL